MDLFIVAGEASGDAQGAKLVEELLKQRPGIRIAAVAGPRMRACKIDAPFQMEDLQVMGFIDVFMAFPKLLKQFKTIRAKILELHPKAVLFIDYPGFNLRLQKSLRKRGYGGKLIQFVCPSVWAWGKKRIPEMAKNLDLLLTLFPFEAKCFADTKLPTRFVGHPLASSIAAFVPDPLFRKKWGIGEKEKILGIFPGSRKKEIERNLPLQIETAKSLAALHPEDPDFCIAVSCANPALEPEIRRLIGKTLLIPPKDSYDLMHSSHFAIATSGTVTLELALHGIPTIVTYAIKPLDLFLAQKIFRINLPFYCIVNILLSKRVFPELFGPHFNRGQLLFWAEKIGKDSKAREECKKECFEIRKLLETKNSKKEAAEALLSMLAF